MEKKQSHHNPNALHSADALRHAHIRAEQVSAEALVQHECLEQERIDRIRQCRVALGTHWNSTLDPTRVVVVWGADGITRVGVYGKIPAECIRAENDVTLYFADGSSATLKRCDYDALVEGSQMGTG